MATINILQNILLCVQQTIEICNKLRGSKLLFLFLGKLNLQYQEETPFDRCIVFMQPYLILSLSCIILYRFFFYT